MDEPKADFVALFDQRLATMRDTARLAAAFYKGLVEEGVDPAAAAQMTAIYAISIQATPDSE